MQNIEPEACRCDSGIWFNTFMKARALPLIVFKLKQYENITCGTCEPLAFPDLASYIRICFDGVLPFRDIKTSASMDLSGDVPVSAISDEDVLIRRLLLMHDPDGRRVDSELLLHLTKNILRCSGLSELSGSRFDVIRSSDTSDIEIRGSSETLQEIICKMQIEMTCKHSGERDLRTQTMSLFNFLERYSWDAKVVLTLAAFAMSYGKLWLIMQLYPLDPLAAYISNLRQLPCDLRTLKPQQRALDLLVKEVVEVASSIIKFESLPIGQVELDNDMMAAARRNVRIAAYWVIRSTLACSTIITDIKSLKPDQVYSSSTILAAWELSSLACKLRSIHNRLEEQVDSCHQQMETRLQKKLLLTFQNPQIDNQEALQLILASNCDLPLKRSSQTKLGVSELKDRVVLLLVSKPELLPLDSILLLVQQTYDHPDHEMLAGAYEILWLPISTSDTWTDTDANMFNMLSNSLPWLSVRKPWSLNPVSVNYIKQQWNYIEEPIILVSDSQGKITNTNALDMLLIWGAKAYPFSSSMEKQMWDREKCTLQLLLDGIDPLISTWVEEGQKMCIYGTDNLDWIAKLNATLKQITSSNQHELQMLKFGCWHQKEASNVEMHSSPFTSTKIHFFWLRLESMRKSLLRLGQAINSNSILNKVSILLENRNEGWLVIGEGSTTEVILLHGREGDNLTKSGFIDALRAAIEPPAPPTPPAQFCNHSSKIPFKEGFIGGTVNCDKCKRPMKLSVVYE